RAELRLNEALKAGPENPSALWARFALGRCAYYLASAEGRLLETPDGLPKEQQGPARQRYRDHLTRARDGFDKVDEELLQRASAAGGQLTPMEQSMIRQAALAAAECDFFLPDYEEAIRRFKHIAVRYPAQVEELAALSFLWQCHYRMNEPAKAREVAVKM